MYSPVSHEHSGVTIDGLHGPTLCVLETWVTWWAEELENIERMSIGAPSIAEGCNPRIIPPAKGQMADAEAVVKAAESGATDEVVRLLEEDPSLLNAVGGYLQGPPLVWAAHSGNAAMVTLLLDRGAQRDQGDRSGRTALYMAAWGGHLHLLKLLLLRGAAPGVVTVMGSTALMIAAASGDLAIVQALLAHSIKDVNAVNRDKETALWKACRWGHVEVARALLMTGNADYTLADAQGKTPLDVARQRGRHACVELLQWFERECDRCYLLHKARKISDAKAMSTFFPDTDKKANTDTTTSPSSTTAFAYLKGRTRSTLPELKARFAPSAAPDQGGDRPGKRKKCNTPEASGGEGEVAAHVLLFVTDRLNEDLYRELMMGLHMR